MKKLTVHVEGPNDAGWVATLLRTAFGPGEYHTIHGRGSRIPIDEVRAATESSSQDDVHIAILDADARTVVEARDKAGLGPDELSNCIFFAIPSIEAWLFADPHVVMRHAAVEHQAKVFRLGPPDEIAFPRDLLKQFFECDKWGRPYDALKIIRETDYKVASARSPSLRAFLTGVGKIIGNVEYEGIPGGYEAFGPRVFASLVGEFKPLTKVVYRTMEGREVTAEQLMQEINEGTLLGRHYVSDLLRMARNMLARDAVNRRDQG